MQPGLRATVLGGWFFSRYPETDTDSENVLVQSKWEAFLGVGIPRGHWGQEEVVLNL